MDNVITYDVETSYPYLDDDLQIDQRTFEAMWRLFCQIKDYWQLSVPETGVKSQLLVFMQNRIKIDLNYYADYKNAAKVIRELTYQLGEQAAYEKLFTDPSANLQPPTTHLARARQRVSNEFITLALAVGGFKTFGAKNALGFISGGNIKGQTPYRTIEEA
ncbi:hypothetical protein [Catenovulum agarivorans]|uniref:hypothetical protein n=1 Tax=Catenovulum agarivorans TaxID=1172192 RepID=UPI000306C071|nr:hypothetical protein [Catenovulum agarivorans]